MLMWTMRDLKLMMDRLCTVDEWWITTGPTPYDINITLKFDFSIDRDDRALVIYAIEETLDMYRTIGTVFSVEDYDMILENLS